MTNTYIPANQEAAEKVTSMLKKQRLFGDVDQFIQLYNEGIINVRKEEIKEIAKEISNSYLNVFIQRDKLYVKSSEETYVEKSLYVLNEWKIVAALKRIANDIVADGNPSDTKLIFFGDKTNSGYVYLEKEVDEFSELTREDLVRYDAAERLTTSSTVIPSNVFLRPLIKEHETFEDAGYIEAYDLINIDDSWLKDVSDTIDIVLEQ